MATITTEFGKVDTKKQRAVYLRLRDKKTEKRIATGIRVNESEISPKTKKIKNFEKAQAVEKLRAELLLKMTAMAPEIHYDDSLDASRIASSIVTKRKVESLDFFSFAEEWISKNSLKSTKNVEKGLKQKDLALLLGKKEAEISKWMRGTHNFTIDTLVTIERALQAPILKVVHRE